MVIYNFFSIFSVIKFILYVWKTIIKLFKLSGIVYDYGKRDTIKS